MLSDDPDALFDLLAAEVVSWDRCRCIVPHAEDLAPLGFV
jgi:hypothetical protein